jgi:hypothetical protein
MKGDGALQAATGQQKNRQLYVATAGSPVEMFQFSVLQELLQS